jgi:hypothetical protein
MLFYYPLATVVVAAIVGVVVAANAVKPSHHLGK